MADGHQRGKVREELVARWAQRAKRLKNNGMTSGRCMTWLSVYFLYLNSSPARAAPVPLMVRSA